MYPEKAVWPRRVARFGALMLVGGIAAAIAYTPDVVGDWIGTPIYWIVIVALALTAFGSSAFFTAMGTIPIKWVGDRIDRSLHKLGEWLTR